MFATRIAKYARHAASFTLHFTHGGLLVAGLIVTLFVASRIATHGVQGLALGSLLGSSPVAAAQAPDSEVQDQTEEVGQEIALSPDLQRVKSYLAKRYQASAVAIEPLLAPAQQHWPVWAYWSSWGSRAKIFGSPIWPAWSMTGAPS